MKDAIITVIAILGIFIGLPVLILWLRDKIFDRPMTREEAEEQEWSPQYLVCKC